MTLAIGLVVGFVLGELVMGKLNLTGRLMWWLLRLGGGGYMLPAPWPWSWGRK